jgi:hypothetical protein
MPAYLPNWPYMVLPVTNTTYSTSSLATDNFTFARFDGGAVIESILAEKPLYFVIVDNLILLESQPMPSSQQIQPESQQIQTPTPIKSAANLFGGHITTSQQASNLPTAPAATPRSTDRKTD